MQELGDDATVALLAGMVGIQLNGQYNNGGAGELTNRGGNWRQHLKNNPHARQHPNYPPPQYHQQPNYPVHQPQYHHNEVQYDTNPDTFDVNSNGTPNLLPIPALRDKNGNNLIPPSIQDEFGQQAQPQINSNSLENVGSFQIPNYGGITPKTNSGGVQGVPSEGVETILKEIRSLKRAINKLTKEFERVKLDMTSNSQPSNEINSIDESSNNVLSTVLPVAEK